MPRHDSGKPAGEPLPVDRPDRSGRRERALGKERVALKQVDSAPEPQVVRRLVELA